MNNFKTIYGSKSWGNLNENKVHGVPEKWENVEVTVAALESSQNDNSVIFMFTGTYQPFSNDGSLGLQKWCWSNCRSQLMTCYAYFMIFTINIENDFF